MFLESSLRNPELAKKISEEIHSKASLLKSPVKIMEVCGTHTVSLRKSGVLSLLPPLIELISGPGCPVCVTPAGYIDNALLLAQENDTIVASFGDMLKVPGTSGKALSRYMGTGKVKIVYSPIEVLKLASETKKKIIFLGIGFETTIPAIAAVFLKAATEKIDNLFLYSAFKTVPIALKILLNDPDRYFNGFLLPGHVSTIIGTKAYEFLKEPGGTPGVIAGFEPIDMLSGILSIVKMILNNKTGVENGYPRAVKEDGNPKARSIMNTLLKPDDEMWRSLGVIPGSGMKLRKEYESFDAEKIFSLPPVTDWEHPGCLCGKVILGKAAPGECTLFKKVCTPDHPIGPCMVSSEGSCAAHLRYGRS